MKTNSLYQIVASFVVQDETGPCILEALKIIKGWNCKWDPSVLIVDNCNQEINALKELFPKALILLCAFHREQSWVRWLNHSKNGLTQSKEDVLKLLRTVADSLDAKSLNVNLNDLITSDLWKKSNKLKKWFCRYWLRKYEMWVRAYMTNILEIVVNTTNGVERLNREFKSCLKDYPDKSLSIMATVLVR